MKRRYVLALAASLAFGANVGPGRAEGLAKPQGDVVLTLTGQITQTNTKQGASFDLAMLKALPAVSFKTTTNWTPSSATFTGVSVDALLALVGAKGNTLHAAALNDYAVDIPASDAMAGGPIIAYALDGVDLSPRDKGPLWVVYPYDSKTEYKTEAIYSRSIWQLSKIDVQK